MAIVDILNIEPHKVSRDLRGYSFMFYGEQTKWLPLMETLR